ncbi:AraC family transcriptional regulator [Pseudomonas sp. D(2018)]|uniref:AraC family transcriptional regulator n=1 Tax=Pseudomonas sp. D(2018) TaxID=2502238 RepID=UPI0010F52EE7|nr:AraC family transcriptional regulator [Pseudomonas sp. D(2018)]
MDVLSEFFERTNLQGRLFFAGRVDGALMLDKPPGMAFIHLVERGGLDLIQPGMPKVSISQPSVLFCPSSCRYQLRSSSTEGAELICASFQFGKGTAQPLPLGLEETLVFPLDALGHALPVIRALVEEFQDQAPGRAKALNLLFEYLFVLLVRRAVQDGRIAGGLFYALQDPRLGAVLSRLHGEPEADWSVERMAGLAAMSRSKFSAWFSRVLGVSPMGYLSGWRMKVAQDLLRDGVPIKVVADAVGYSSQASFSRTFASLVGCPPAEWLRQDAREAPTVKARLTAADD